MAVQPPGSTLVVPRGAVAASALDPVPPGLVVCTIVARNYLAHARVLARSYSEHHHGRQLRVLIVDGGIAPYDPAAEPFVSILPEELPLPAGDLQRMAAMYDVMELSTALKPFLLKHLIASGAESAVYLDPDIKLFAPLAEVAALLAAHPILLTPHFLEPMPSDGRGPTFAFVAAAGIYNLGFVAVSASAAEFLDWWGDKLRRHCIVAVEEQLFVDQRVIDFTPPRFAPYVLDRRSHNVAYWNLHERSVAWSSDDRYEVNGEPLVFFHFSGFDPEKPHMLSKHQGVAPRILLSEHVDLARLCSEYANELLAAGYEDAKALPYGFATTASGLPFDRRIRRIYRAALLDSEAVAGPEPPNPLVPADARRFVTWLSEPSAPNTAVSRYLMAVHAERTDLQRAFPEPLGCDAAAYLEWVALGEPVAPPIPDEIRTLSLRPPASGPQVEAVMTPRRPGVNVLGYVDADLGVGESARLTIAALRAAHIPYSVTTVEQTWSRRVPYHDSSATSETYDVSIVHVNADMFPSFVRQYQRSLPIGGYVIGAWAWEIEEFPQWMAESESLVDEIWAISDFAAEAIRHKVSRPVYTFAPPIVPVLRQPSDEKRNDLAPTGFVFLFCFDFLSILERKNPRAVIEAFSQAFAPDEGPVLLIKTINGDLAIDKLEELRWLSHGRSDIVIDNRYVSRDELHDVMARADCYVSLHRAEGYGLTMAESMALGKPVIATGYSGNLEFMTQDNSLLVPYAIGRVPPGCDPYPPGSMWAEPLVAAAAEAMRAVYNDEELRRRVGERARWDIEQHHAPETRAPFLRERLSAIRESQAATATEAQHPDTGLETLLELSNSAPRLGSRWGVIRQAQRGLLRALRPLQIHQREVTTGLAAAIKRLDEEIHTPDAANADIARRLEALEKSRQELLLNLSELHAPSASQSAAERRLETIEASLHAQPYMADPEQFDHVPGLTTRDAMGYSAGPNGDGRAYMHFEDVFRGPEQLVRGRQSFYVEVVREMQPIVDLGSGRGEFLDLAREAGLDITGVDNDASMVAHCREKGHQVIHDDALAFLESRPPASLGAIVSFQLIEHLSVASLRRLLELSVERLRIGGLFIAETVNPHSLRAYKTFWTDLTHEKPIFPETLLVLARSHGFGSASVVFANGTGDAATDARHEGDYALVARRD
jgi:glycosyltransferase involved in cell wall biosynthesis